MSASPAFTPCAIASKNSLPNVWSNSKMRLSNLTFWKRRFRSDAGLRHRIRPYAVASDRETASIHRRLVEKLALRMSQHVPPPLRVLEHQPALPPPLNIPQLFIN